MKVLSLISSEENNVEQYAKIKNINCTILASSNVKVQVPTEKSQTYQAQIPVNNTTNLIAAIVNLPYSFKFSSLGDSGTKTYSLEDETLPIGLTFIQDGTLSGTPTSSGNFNFKIKVTDESGQSSDNEFTLVVNEPAPPIQAGITLNLKFTG